jgi:hypothetical protein
MGAGPGEYALSTDNLREQRLKHVTGFATRLARTQINEAIESFAPLGKDGDDELAAVLWGAYVGHVAGRLTGILGRGRAHAIIHELLTTYEKSHDH